MKVMYSSLLEDDLIIVGQTSTFVAQDTTCLRLDFQVVSFWVLVPGMLRFVPYNKIHPTTTILLVGGPELPSVLAENDSPILGSSMISCHEFTIPPPQSSIRMRNYGVLIAQCPLIRLYVAPWRKEDYNLVLPILTGLAGQKLLRPSRNRSGRRKMR